MDAYWMGHALAEAMAAGAAGEVPVGAVLVRGGEIIAVGRNCAIARHDPTAHAEIVAMRTAGDRLANYRLPGTVLYVTLEPCPMCAAALVYARVRRVVFGASDPRIGAAGTVFQLLDNKHMNHRIGFTGGVRAEEAADLLRRFFRARRGAGVAPRVGPDARPSDDK